MNLVDVLVRHIAKEVEDNANRPSREEYLEALDQIISDLQANYEAIKEEIELNS